jgi:hypothetical protein
MGSGLNIQQLDHSDTTSEVTYTYDRRGRRATVVQVDTQWGQVSKFNIACLMVGSRLASKKSVLCFSANPPTAALTVA